MNIFSEVIAILYLVIMFTLNSENTGGTGEEKKAKTVTDIMAYLRSPGGLYINNETILKVIEFALNAFVIDLIVAGWNKRSFLGISTGSLNSPEQPSANT